MSTTQVPGDRLLGFADTLLAAGIQYGLWVERAPGVEEEVAMSSMSQDKLGHARAFQQLAEKALGRTAIELQYDRAPSEFAWNPAWTIPLPTWDHMLIAKALFARATFADIEAAGASDPVASLLPKLRQEEAWHWRHADAWLAQRAAEDASAVQAVLEELWPLVVTYHDDEAVGSPFRGEAAGVLERAGLKPGPEKADPAVVEALRSRAADNAVELAALLQDPQGRAVAEL